MKSKKSVKKKTTRKKTVYKTGKVNIGKELQASPKYYWLSNIAPAKSVSTTLTLSKYSWGMHYIDDKCVPKDASSNVSFKESWVPVHDLAQLLYSVGVKLGTKVKITMVPIEE